jgi:polyhydroxyalkanoate synthase
VKQPVFAVACETDHIAPWKGCFTGFRQLGSKDKTFVVSESGHIAGIVNPPTKEKYGHYTSDGPMELADDWMKDAVYTKGSWWPRWLDWMSKRAGKMIAARQIGESGFPEIEPAPGLYVRERPNV